MRHRWSSPSRGSTRPGRPPGPAGKRSSPRWPSPNGPPSRPPSSSAASPRRARGERSRPARPAGPARPARPAGPAAGRRRRVVRAARDRAGGPRPGARVRPGGGLLPRRAPRGGAAPHLAVARLPGPAARRADLHPGRRRQPGLGGRAAPLRGHRPRGRLRDDPGHRFVDGPRGLRARRCGERPRREGDPGGRPARLDAARAAGRGGRRLPRELPGDPRPGLAPAPPGGRPPAPAADRGGRVERRGGGLRRPRRLHRAGPAGQRRGAGRGRRPVRAPGLRRGGGGRRSGPQDDRRRGDVPRGGPGGGGGDRTGAVRRVARRRRAVRRPRRPGARPGARAGGRRLRADREPGQPHHVHRLPGRRRRVARAAHRARGRRRVLLPADASALPEAHRPGQPGGPPPRGRGAVDVAGGDRRAPSRDARVGARQLASRGIEVPQPSDPAAPD